MLTKKNKIKKLLIKPNALVKDAIKNLNESELKIILVVKNNKLLGTIVDGDIRRGMLNGVSINDNIKNIVHKKPIVAKSNVNKDKIFTLMKENKLQHIPIINKSKKPIGLYMLDEINNKMQRGNNFVIMAGGLGKRLLPQTKKTPKAMINISGAPMLEHVVLQAKKCGFFNFVFSINHLGQVIKKHFLNGKKININIKYVEEKAFLGTAGSLCYLKNLKDKTIIVTNCDVLSNIDYAKALDYHNAYSADATMVVRNYTTHNSFGVVETKGTNFLSCKEKPIIDQNINAGIYILETKILKLIKHEKYLDMPDFFMKLRNEKKKVIVYPIYESWVDLGKK